MQTILSAIRHVAARSHRDARRQAALRPRAVRDDRRSLRLHHRRAVVRPGSAVEAAADRAGGAARRRRARSTWRPAPATSRSRWPRRGARVVGLDITQRMIELARDKAASQPATAALPRRRHAGAAVSRPRRSTSSRPATALRNVPDLARGDRRDPPRADAGRPGRCRSISTARRTASFARAYLAYLTRRRRRRSAGCCTAIPDTYRYIPASIRRYPGAEGGGPPDARRAASREVRCYPVLGGLMAIHHAVRT